MNVTNQIVDVINKIADKIGIATNQILEYIKQLYMIYVKQAYVKGIQDIIWVLISIILILIASKLLIKSFQNPAKVHKDNNWKDYDFPNTNNIDVAKRFICPIVILLFFIIAITCSHEAITCFVDPEYWAYKHLISDLELYIQLTK